MFGNFVELLQEVGALLLEASKSAGDAFLLSGVESIWVGCCPDVCGRKEPLKDDALGRVARAVVGWIGRVVAT